MSALDWWRAVPATATALILLLGPGWLAARAWGLRRWTAAGAALPLGAAVVGLAEILAAAAGARWLPWGWAVIAALTCALALPGPLLRARRRRTPGGPDPSGPSHSPGTGARAEPDAGSSRLMAGAVGAAVCALGAALVIGMGSPATPPQAFDAVFHLAAVGAVREGGSASSLGGLSALYQGAPVYYPSVWHGMVALLPGGATAASNAMILVVGAVAWPLGVAGLLTEALRAVPRGRADEPDSGVGSDADRDACSAHRARERAVALVTVLSAATVGAPTVLLTALAAWPYALSVVALPGALALAVRARRAVAQHCGRGATAPAALVLAALAVLGVALAHGTGLFNIAILLLPAAVSDTAGLLRRGGRTRLIALVCLAAAALIAGVGAWAMRGPLAGLFGYERPGGSAAGTLVQALIDLPQYGPLASHGLPAGVVLLALVVLGLRAHRDERVRPWAGAALAALVLVVLVGGPQWPGRQVGFPWYLQKSRIEPVLLIPMLVLAAHGAVALLSPDGAVRPGRLRRPAAVLAPLVLVAVAGRIPLQIELARSVYDAERIAFGTLTTPEELAFYASVGDALPAGAVVVGSPSRGATYLGPVADVELVYPTRVRPREGSAELALARAAPDPRPGSEACALLDELGAEYYVSVERDPAGLRYGNAPLRWDDRLAAWPTTGMELVDRADTGRGVVALWRITACG